MAQLVSSDIRHKIRQIEIYTRRLLSGSMVGDARSAQKGVGFDFDQLRDYQPGDDVRCIDWRASARMGTLLVKQYKEERSRTILLLVDMSASSLSVIGDEKRSDLFARIASVLALVGQYGNDAVGLLIFSDKVDYYLPPRRGMFAIRAVMEKVFSHRVRPSTTDLGAALDYVARVKKSDVILFILSDFIADSFEQQLRIIASKWDVVAIRALDSKEQRLPAVGFLTVQDIETGTEICLDTRAKNAHKVDRCLQQRIAEQDMLFKKYNVACIDVADTKGFIADIVRFFRRRMRY